MVTRGGRKQQRKKAAAAEKVAEETTAASTAQQAAGTVVKGEADMARGVSVAEAATTELVSLGKRVILIKKVKGDIQEVLGGPDPG